MSQIGTPDDCRSQLQSLVSATNGNFKNIIQARGTIVDLPAGTVGSAVQASNGVLTRTSKCCHNGYVVDSELYVADFGIKCCDWSFADGSVNGFATFEEIND